MSRWMDGASTPDSAQSNIRNPSYVPVGDMRVLCKVVEQKRPGSGQSTQGGETHDQRQSPPTQAAAAGKKNPQHKTGPPLASGHPLS